MDVFANSSASKLETSHEMLCIFQLPEFTERLEDSDVVLLFAFPKFEVLVTKGNCFMQKTFIHYLLRKVELF